MEVEELRIGNCVQRHELTPIETISVITELSIEIDFTNLLGIEHFEPIPLTEEWLIKFGFVSNPYEDRYEKTGFNIECNKTRGYLEFWFVSAAPTLKYVHSLQNLYFALTGEELKIQKQDETKNSD